MITIHSGRPAIVATFSVVVICLTPVAASADKVREAQWYLGALNLQAANSVSQGEGVVIADVDTGVDRAHPDLDGAILPSLKAGSQDGRTLDKGHGTAMAGIMVGRGRSGSNGI